MTTTHERAPLMTELPTLPGPGDVVGDNFKLTRELGRGTFGVVFEAHQVDLGRRVAIKFLQPSMLDRDGIGERFVREARLASSLNNQNAIVIYAYGTHATSTNARELPYIAMELLDGQDLQQYTAARGPLSLREAVAVILEALRCLEQAHRLGIIHRDLKPENLFLAQLPNGSTRVKVLDFGIAKAVSGNWGSRTMAGVTMVGHVVGTPAFMSPEQARGEPDLGPAVDTYAIGCVAFDTIAGRPPYDGRTPMEIALNHITQPTPRLPDLDGNPVADVIYQAMSKEASARYPDADAFSEALRAAAARAGITPAMPRWIHDVEINLAATSGAFRAQPATDDPDASLRTQRLDAILPSSAPTQLLDKNTLAATPEPQDSTTPTAPDGRNATAVVPSLAEVASHHPVEADDPESTRRNHGLLIAMGIAAIIFLLLSLLLLIAVVRSGNRTRPDAQPDATPSSTAPTSITIDSEPPGAHVFVNDTPIGLTPLHLDPADAPRRITLRKEGFADAEQLLAPTATRLAVTLQPTPHHDAHDAAGPAPDTTPPPSSERPPDNADNVNTRRRTVRPTNQKPALDVPLQPPASTPPTRRRRTPEIPLWDHENR